MRPECPLLSYRLLTILCATAGGHRYRSQHQTQPLPLHQTKKPPHPPPTTHPQPHPLQPPPLPLPLHPAQPRDLEDLRASFPRPHFPPARAHARNPAHPSTLLIPRNSPSSQHKKTPNDAGSGCLEKSMRRRWRVGTRRRGGRRSGGLRGRRWRGSDRGRRRNGRRGGEGPRGCETRLSRRSRRRSAIYCLHPKRTCIRALLSG